MKWVASWIFVLIFVVIDFGNLIENGMKFDDPMRFLMKKVDLPDIDASQGPLLAHASPASSSHDGGCGCPIKGPRRLDSKRVGCRLLSIWKF